VLFVRRRIRAIRVQEYPYEKPAATYINSCAHRSSWI
jgi:hypothetical protein